MIWDDSILSVLNTNIEMGFVLLSYILNFLRTEFGPGICRIQVFAWLIEKRRKETGFCCCNFKNFILLHLLLKPVAFEIGQKDEKTNHK